MTSRLVALTIDANEPLRMARFWAEALQCEFNESSGEITLVPTNETSFKIVFEPVAEKKMGRNRNHLDLTTSSFEDQSETVAKLIELDARHIDIGQGPDDHHVVLSDPEGNEFCVIEPTNTFLAECGRLGAINCDGSRETGYFWSAALGWPIVWDQDEETAIRPPEGGGPMITWSGTPLMVKIGKNRMHLGIAPFGDEDQRSLVDRLISLGATRADIGQGAVSWVVMADPDGNEFCVLAPQDS